MARHEITYRRVIYELPGMPDVPVRREIEYAHTAAGPLTMDVYRPPAAAADRRLPAVVIVGGYADVGVPLTLGCVGKDMEMVISWAQLIAVSGLTAIAYTKQDPSRDVLRLFEFLRANADALSIDPGRLGIWAASGNVPVALSLLMEGAAANVACAVLCYGYMLDAPGTSVVATAAATWKFANPAAGRSVGDLRTGVPLFVARAGADTFPDLNAAIDRFIHDALARDLPLTLVNVARAPHAFDLVEATDASRHVIRTILEFQHHHLMTPAR